MIPGKHKSNYRPSSKPKFYSDHQASNRGSFFLGNNYNTSALDSYHEHSTHYGRNYTPPWGHYPHHEHARDKPTHHAPPTRDKPTHHDHHDYFHHDNARDRPSVHRDHDKVQNSTENQWPDKDANNKDEASWFKEVTRCNHFERDHYCKSLTHCPYFHEGIDCIRFFTRRPCDGNECKFKHRVVLSLPSEPHDRNKDTKGKHNDLGKDEYREKDVQDKIRDIHKDKSFYSKTKPPDEHSKKRTHSEHHGVTDNADTSKRAKRMYDYDPSHTEAAKEDERRVLRRSSGGVEISLPPNWKAAWSKQGEIYYYNTVTGERTWDLPEDKPTKEPTPGRSDIKPKEKYSQHKEKRGTDKPNKEKESKTTHKHKKTTDRPTEERKETKTESERKPKEERESAKEEQPSKQDVTSPPGEDKHQQAPEPTTQNTGTDVEQEGEVESDNDEETPAKPLSQNRLRPDAIRVFATTPILTHLLHPSLSELVTQLQQQSSTLYKPKISPFTVSHRDTSFTTSTTPIPHKSSSAAPSAPTSPDTTPDTTSNTDSETTLTCLRCSKLPTNEKLIEALQANLRYYCCPRCVKQLDQEAITKKLIQLHMSPGLYDSTKKNQAILDAMNETHSTLLSLYKKT